MVNDSRNYTFKRKTEMLSLLKTVDSISTYQFIIIKELVIVIHSEIHTKPSGKY